MKKTSAVVVAVVVCMIAGSAMASKCDYFQWKNCQKAKAAPAPKVAPMPEKIVLEGVYFDTGSAKIKPESYGILDNNAKQLNKDKKADVTIVGYTDNAGSVAKNKKLSEERAISVKDYLVSKGVDSSRLNTKGLGPDNPIADNSTKDGKAKNRRIEMEMHK